MRKRVSVRDQIKILVLVYIIIWKNIIFWWFGDPSSYHTYNYYTNHQHNDTLVTIQPLPFWISMIMSAPAIQILFWFIFSHFNIPPFWFFPNIQRIRMRFERCLFVKKLFHFPFLNASLYHSSFLLCHNCTIKYKYTKNWPNENMITINFRKKYYFYPNILTKF